MTTSVPAFTTALRRHAACCAIGTKRRLAGRRGITARFTYAAPPITIALRTGAGGSEANPYAERSGAFYPVLGAYAGQLYELDTGDTCSTYVPPMPLIAHSIGTALGEDAFARATLIPE